MFLLNHERFLLRFCERSCGMICTLRMLPPSLEEPRRTLASIPQSPHPGQHGSFRDSKSEFHCALSTSVSLIIFSASSSVNFSPTFFFTCRTASHGSSPRQTTRCSRSCQSSRCAPAVPRQSSAPAGWSSTLVVVTCSATMFVGRHVCCAVWVMRHFILTLPFVALVSGHPRPSVGTAPVYRGCPCRDKKKGMTHPG